MSDLLASLSAAGRALGAQRFGLDVTGQNIANVNTPGFARRQVDLVAVQSAAGGGAGQGVEVRGVRVLRDLLLERRLRDEGAAEQREAAAADTLAVVEVALGRPGASIDAALTEFFDAFSMLADDPLGATARQGVIGEGQSLAGSFNTMADRLASAQRDADLRIRAQAVEINDLATRVASLNGAIAVASTSSSGAAALQDELHVTLRDLASRITIRTVDTADGAVDVSFGNGRPLVVGRQAYSLDVTSEPPNGFAGLRSGGTLVSGELTGGSIGGLLKVRDTLVPDYLTRLDAMAFAVVQEVNSRHVAGFDRNGAPAGAFFNALGSATGAAAAIAVSAAVAADPDLVAAAGVALPGDNQAARALADLRDTPVLNGGTSTLGDAWAQLAYRVGHDTQDAQRNQEMRAGIVRQVEALRDAVSGVSLDEETVRLMRFQRAYQANAQFFRVADETITMMMQMLGA